jgi:hypothetical protein
MAMNLGRFIIVGSVLGMISHAALAFQETNDGGKSAADKDAVGQRLNTPLPQPKSDGQPIKVPGLGTIGVLPKLDFGLELLYGASGSAPTGPMDDKAESGAQIRGTLKYRFPN